MTNYDGHVEPGGATISRAIDVVGATVEIRKLSVGLMDNTPTCCAMSTVTLSFDRVTVDGTRQLKLSGRLSVADAAERCVRRRQVFIERYNERTGDWDSVDSDATDTAGRYVYKSRDIAAKYRARVAADDVTYDGFTSRCSTASIAKRHSH